MERFIESVRMTLPVNYSLAVLEDACRKDDIKYILNNWHDIPYFHNKHLCEIARASNSNEVYNTISLQRLSNTMNLCVKRVQVQWTYYCDKYHIYDDYFRGQFIKVMNHFNIEEFEKMESRVGLLPLVEVMILLSVFWTVKGLKDRNQILYAMMKDMRETINNLKELDLEFIPGNFQDDFTRLGI